MWKFFARFFFVERWQHPHGCAGRRRRRASRWWCRTRLTRPKWRPEWNYHELKESSRTVVLIAKKWMFHDFYNCFMAPRGPVLLAARESSLKKIQIWSNTLIEPVQSFLAKLRRIEALTSLHSFWIRRVAVLDMTATKSITKETREPRKTMILQKSWKEKWSKIQMKWARTLTGSGAGRYRIFERWSTFNFLNW